jgi:hypothetical protein
VPSFSYTYSFQAWAGRRASSIFVCIVGGIPCIAIPNDKIAMLPIRFPSFNLDVLAKSKVFKSSLKGWVFSGTRGREFEPPQARHISLLL